MAGLRILITLVAFVNLVYSQNLVVVYEAYKKVPDAIISGNPRLEAIRSEFATEKIKYRYSLRITSGESLYSLDSVYVERKSRLQSVIGGTHIYKNYGKDEWLKVSGRYREGYGYQRKISEMLEERPHQWKRTGREKRILGFRCIEVVADQKRAYYAADIPIPDGPSDGVFGLPGLVLEYHSPIKSFVAVELSSPAALEICKPEAIPVTEESKILLTLDEYRHAPPSRVIVIDAQTPIHRWIKFQRD